MSSKTCVLKKWEFECLSSSGVFFCWALMRGLLITCHILQLNCINLCGIICFSNCILSPGATENGTEEATMHFMVNVIEPQFNLQSEDARVINVLNAVDPKDNLGI